MRVAPRVEVSEGVRAKLERWASSRSAPVRLRERSLIVLGASAGLTNKEIAAELGLEVNKVGRWRRRYAEEGLAGIEKERARGGNQGGAFTSVCHLEESIRQCLDTYNENPRPLVWTKSTGEILEKVGRARAKLAATS